MISVEAAKNSIRSALRPLPPVIMPLSKAAGLVLAEDISAPADVPGFDQSAMDGYALRFDDKDKPLPVLSEAAAGSSRQRLPAHQAMRIFTGAMIPEGADTVVMQEKVTVANGLLEVLDENLAKGRNIRPRGSEIRAGATALSKAAVLGPAASGFLAGLGLSVVPVFPPPRVSVIVTGRELVAPGTKAAPGQVYESNSFALAAALAAAGIPQVNLIHADDDLPLLQSVLEKALEQSDMVLLTGGVSVGDYDFVKQAALGCGVETRFHKVKQKPGKPLYFGMKGALPVFGLPGNPSSVLTCFYEYVSLALEIFLQKKSSITTTTARIDLPYRKAAGLAHFLKGYYERGKVQLLDAQESYKMRSFAHANCLICVPEQATEIMPGDDVDIHLID